jgi:integrase
VLSNAEIIWFWRATDAVGEPYGSLFKLLLLTGARLNEVAGMRRDELSKDLATWGLSGERTKNKRAHIVPLPPLVREILSGVQSTSDSLAFSTTGSNAVSGWSRVKNRLDKIMLAIARKEKPGATIPHWRLHDLRRSAVTGMVELGVPPHVVEQVVNHVSGTRASVAGTYNRSQMLPERKAALERWSLHIAGLVADRANVVAMKKAKH